MRAVRPFLFERRFDLPARPEDGQPSHVVIACADEPPALEKRYDEDDLARARAEGGEEGLANGLAQGRAEALAEAEASDRGRLVLACEAVAARLDRLAAVAERTSAEEGRSGVLLAVAIAKKLLPEYCRRHGITEIEGVARQIVGQVRDERRLMVKVAPALSEGLRERLQPIADGAGFAGDLLVLAEPGIAEGDCTVEWSTGGAERNAAALWQRIDALVERALADHEHAAPEAAPGTEDKA